MFSLSFLFFFLFFPAVPHIRMGCGGCSEGRLSTVTFALGFMLTLCPGQAFIYVVSSLLKNDYCYCIFWPLVSLQSRSIGLLRNPKHRHSARTRFIKFIKDNNVNCAIYLVSFVKWFRLFWDVELKPLVWCSLLYYRFDVIIVVVLLIRLYPCDF